MHYLLVNIICALTLSNASPDVERAQQTLDSLYQNYAAPNTCLLPLAVFGHILCSKCITGEHWK